MSTDRSQRRLRQAGQRFRSWCLMNGLSNRCCVCRAPTRLIELCPRCYRHLPWNRAPCRLCAEPVARAGDACIACQLKRTPEDLDQVLGPWLYDTPIDQMITALKFNQALNAGHLLGHLLGRRAQAYLRNSRGQIDAIIPAPLHRRRLRQRGYNQALEIARAVARSTGIPMRLDLLERVRYTQPQTALTLSERARNVQAAFKAYPADKVHRVAVIDDVATTLSTARAMARALRSAGYARIELWVACRTSPPG